MHDPRCWRELLIRAGIMVLIAAIADFLLGQGPWVWLIPLGTALLVLVKWAARPAEEDGERPDDEPMGCP